MLCRKILQDLPIIWKIFLNLRKELEKVEKTSAPIGLWQKNILMSEILLDAVDLQILRALQENARLTTKELAARVNLSTTPVFERLKRLERGGFILKYVAVLDAEKLGRGFTVFCSVKLKQMNRNVAKNFISVIRDIPQVAECYNISGEYDYLLKIQAPDMKYYNEFIINVLGTIDSIGSILSSFVMDEIKNTHALYL
jgi:Transcriptional regulators